ncbi:acetylmuramic acid-6-phosphate etherase [Devosia soli]|uniref:Acetylmuramic acid-6-phosphate etherase n=1 Tax=Devosia soli TaxID=361041 RepID=A0A0F5LG88_9HYPH|nr:N-acetylmuramic acid 6-phosphate etherase [Devosia soli]KKB81320.1 acetylmuramic acid-6-phosphate etherase [Devosia soli]
MAERQTEKRHHAADGLELRAPTDILSLLAKGQAEAAASVALAVDEIARASEMSANAIRSGGRLIYAAAGSSGLMALADALELPGTYGIRREQIVVILAGGMESLVNMIGGPEDDGDAAKKAIEDLSPSDRDCVIGITASGETPFPVAALQAARRAGAKTVGLSNNSGAAILETADVGICLPTPPEVIAGSTRMGAGTAQKIALNMLSTLMAIHLGHVHDGFMVNVIADNLKLQQRARGIVAAIAHTGEDKAAEALAKSQGDVKPAVLIAAGARDLTEAQAMLKAHDGHLRPALRALQR